MDDVRRAVLGSLRTILVSHSQRHIFGVCETETTGTHMAIRGVSLHGTLSMLLGVNDPPTGLTGRFAMRPSEAQYLELSSLAGVTAAATRTASVRQLPLLGEMAAFTRRQIRELSGAGGGCFRRSCGPPSRPARSLRGSLARSIKALEPWLVWVGVRVRHESQL